MVSTCSIDPMQLSVGVLGGSISWGAELPHKETQRWSALLANQLHANVLNRAMPATGVGYASYCVDAILPELVDVLVVEYNFNVPTRRR